MTIPLSQWSAHDIVVRTGGSRIPVDLASYADHVERVVLDLHVGSAFYQSGADAGKELPGNRRLLIRPGQMIRIKTREELHVGPEVFGQLVSRSSLTARGLVVASIKIDPKFVGRLTVVVFNVGETRIEVPREDGFCSVFFHKLASAVDGDIRTPPEDPNRKSTSLVDWFGRNWRAVLAAAITLIVSVVGSIIAAARTARHTHTTGHAEELRRLMSTRIQALTHVLSLSWRA